MKLLQAWIELHQDELMADWELHCQENIRIRLIRCGDYNESSF